MEKQMINRNERKDYIDNIRWFTVILVVIYHVPYAFNNVGVLGGIGPDKCFVPMNDFMSLVYPWFMMLLFLLAGMSAKYSLSKEDMTGKKFIKGKTDKLLIPSTLGLLIVHPITGYLNLKIGGALEFIPSFILPFVVILSSTGVLWFAQLLYVFSVLIVLINKLCKKRVVNKEAKKIPDKFIMPSLLTLVLLVWLSAQMLNMPVITVYRFGVYFTCYLMGYFIFSIEEITDKLAQNSKWLFLGAIVLAIAYVIYYHGENITEDAILKNFFTNAYAWIAILAALGIGKSTFNKKGQCAAYFHKRSFGMYVLHYPVMIAVGYYLYTCTKLSGLTLYIVVWLAEFVGSILLYEITSRIPVVRYLLFGIKSRKKENTLSPNGNL